MSALRLPSNSSYNKSMHFYRGRIRMSIVKVPKFSNGSTAFHCTFRCRKTVLKGFVFVHMVFILFLIIKTKVAFVSFPSDKNVRDFIFQCLIFVIYGNTTLCPIPLYKSRKYIKNTVLNQCHKKIDVVFFTSVVQFV